MNIRIAWRPKSSLHSRDAGNATVEAAILAPLFILFLAGLLTAMRVQHGAAVVTQAAADAARQASIARTVGRARAGAVTSAMTTLRDHDLHCTPTVRLDLAGFGRPVGQGAVVSARVTCAIRLADVALPGMPGTRTVTKTHRSPIDPYRAKAG
ncbi:TadE/TadG family type IV pilus assembly protein [Actinomadura macra]|uniref:TadE/TadG family type IV pilus assembly protein n=1 Tax=Actinomadura macra TaxID=46164 RepID=UPI00083291EC|nr:TadE/TadG family type IV pilus assembly protein [Actinomadura macra]